MSYDYGLLSVQSLCETQDSAVNVMVPGPFLEFLIPTIVISRRTK